MEEKDVIKNLNWYYYGVMVFTLIILAVMYYLASRPDFETLAPGSEIGMILQYVVIGLALLGIPAGLYSVKFLKPDTLEKYERIATFRILIIGLNMPLAVCAYYLMGYYQSMMWVAAIAAIGWYFTKPTLGKLEQEMKPKDPNEETY